MGEYKGEISQELIAEMIAEIRRQVEGLVSELATFQKVFNEHTHDVSVGMRGIKSSDFETPMSADDQFYGQPHEYEIAVVRQRDLEVAVKALQSLADFSSGYSSSDAIRIAREALEAIGREMPKSDSEGDENDGDD